MEPVHLSSPSRYTLYHFSDRFYIEPIASKGYVDSPAVGTNLEIDRFSSELKLKQSTAPISVDSSKIQPIDGLVGIIQLVSGPYLIVISKSTSVGTLNGADIYRVIRTELIPFRTSEAHLSENERHANQIFVEMLETVLKCDAFYYSHRMDISHSFQWLSENATPNFHQQPLFQRIDRNFVWNTRLCVLFTSAQLSSFAIPLIHGFVGIRKCVVNDRPFKLALISRRSVQRAGVRFHTRGLDREGNCANFVETEQIVQFDTKSGKNQRHLASFVQIRASIPLFWAQRTNLRWQPDPSHLPKNEQIAAYRAHLNALFNRYGKDANGNPRKIFIVNLINQYGREHILGKLFHSVVDSVKFDNVRFEHFDFHRHCSSLNWDRLSELHERLAPEVNNFGFFLTKLERKSGGKNSDGLLEGSSEVGERKYQNGLFRTNCMDCLDRTNVVQALLAMESLRLQLQSIGILPQNVKNFDAWPGFVYTFKNLWADNGDDCSKQYAGTAALKTDYTRIGRRTFGGALQDAHNSLMRYFKNNWSDGYRQDAINLFLGNYVVNRYNLPAGLDHSPVAFDLNGFAIVFSVITFAMTILCLLVSENPFIALFWLALSVLVLSFIWLHGEDFSDRPRLVVSGN
ncbi:hypothetical protein niasHS_000669 [Heterodera schachtii]|uniref:Phosphatidylinositol-3-phosphatase SAC1 n=1 Tax=Heterodera schachtii TaxID=97005 RepID=A0ABD2K4X3_HETSC